MRPSPISASINKNYLWYNQNMDHPLEAGLAALGESDPVVERVFGSRKDGITALLEKYIGEIELFNPAYGLVKVKDRRELVVKHILDSLAPLGIILREWAGGAASGPGAFRGRRIADLGSGAGLPGIPLAICLPECRVTLIERMGRRAGFLANTLGVLGLKNAEVEAGEMEKAAPGRFDCAVFRALKPLDPALLKTLFRLLGQNGFLAAYKGRKAAAGAELGALKDLGGGKIIPSPVPFLGEERHLLIIRPA
jgi:16S rRNA (guanine527-N7)-methyltransferase